MVSCRQVASYHAASRACHHAVHLKNEPSRSHGTKMFQPTRLSMQIRPDESQYVFSFPRTICPKRCLINSTAGPLSATVGRILATRNVERMAWRNWVISTDGMVRWVHLSSEPKAATEDVPVYIVRN